MDHIKQDLDELMGKDRNTPLHLRLQKRDHFDDEQVIYPIQSTNFQLGVQIQSSVFLSPRLVPKYKSRSPSVINSKPLTSFKSLDARRDTMSFLETCSKQIPRGRPTRGSMRRNYRVYWRR
mgnify:CR=1 FL=1